MLRLEQESQAPLGPKSQVHVCIDTPRYSCTGTGSIDDPLEKPGSNVARVVERTDLDNVGQRRGRLLGRWEHP